METKRMTFLDVCHCSRVKKYKDVWEVIPMTLCEFLQTLTAGFKDGDTTELIITVETCPVCKKTAEQETEACL
jgi:uncharacterized membrane protein YgaE (UPF0421/DUF939 family)